MTKKKESDVLSDVCDYLKRTNRPYSANDITNNLKKEHGKSAITKALETLATKGKIHEKLYGKQKVYMIIQEDVEYNDAHLTELDNEISSKKQSLEQLQKELKKINDELGACQREMSISELKTKISELETSNKRVEELLESYQQNQNVITKEEKENVKNDYIKHKTLFTKRKKMAIAMLDVLLENCDKPKKELLEEIGIETDQDVNFTIKNY